MTEREHKKLTSVQTQKKLHLAETPRVPNLNLKSPQNCRFSPMEVST